MHSAHPVVPRVERQRQVILVILACVVILACAVPLSLRATSPDPADHSIKQFLAHDDTQPSYRALRRLEAENGKRSGWIEAMTEYSPEKGFHYEILAEGGSGFIRNKVLRAVLEAEREAIEQGESARSALAPLNYTFQANGVDADGLANVLLSPRRRERTLVEGTLFLQPADGELVRLEGRLAKNPSFWVKNVDIVRAYQRIDGIVVPVALASTAQLRMMGSGMLRMTYAYSEIGGRILPSSVAASR
jgi:hypothetical protein